MCCATPCRSIRSIPVASTSEQLEVRFTRRPTVVIRGIQSCAIFQLFCRSKCQCYAKEIPNPDFMIRVVLPHHLRTLAHVGDEIHVDPNGSTTARTIIDAIEEKYPMLGVTIRDHETQESEPLVRFFTCG